MTWLAFLSALPQMLTALIQGWAEFAKWKAEEAELKNKKFLYDLIECDENRSDELARQLDELRSRGDNLGADRLRRAQARRAFFRSTLSTSLLNTGKGVEGESGGGNLHPAAKGDVGGHVEVSGN